MNDLLVVQALPFLLFALIGSIPVFFINKWLQQVMKPRESVLRLLLYFLVMLAVVFLFTLAVSFIGFRWFS